MYDVVDQTVLSGLIVVYSKLYESIVFDIALFSISPDECHLHFQPSVLLQLLSCSAFD